MKPKILIPVLALLTATSAILFLRPKATLPRVEPPAADVTVDRTDLSLVDGRLCLTGQTNPFTGIMIEVGANELLRSRSAISNGWLHGLSQGWHTNGQLQISEHFAEGVSHGLRTKYYESGTKLSEGEIVAGKFHGTFRRWSEDGALLEQAEFVEGQPDGVAFAYFPDGKLKARAVMRDGKLLEMSSREGSATPP